MAIVSSLRMFDREQRKEFLVPIVIKDSGSPAMSGTSTLTVIIGDINDNKMMPGTKEILVYNYVGQGVTPDTDIGRVYVFDLDDWDLPDKKFYWKDRERRHPRFLLDEDSGMITMKQDTLPGMYVYIEHRMHSTMYAGASRQLFKIYVLWVCMDFTAMSLNLTSLTATTPSWAFPPT